MSHENSGFFRRTRDDLANQSAETSELTNKLDRVRSLNSVVKSYKNV